MSFSNTDTGDKPSDPYKEANEEDPGLVHKVRDLVEFITACKFGMMTTHHASTLDLVSRCMALAATVRSTRLLRSRARLLLTPSVCTGDRRD